MPDSQKPSASDFLAAARKQAAQDQTSVLKSRRQVMEDFLSMPAPQDSDLHYNNTVYQRMKARFVLAFGDIFETLEKLPAKQGKKFVLEIDISTSTDRIYVWCRYKGPTSKKNTVSPSMTYASFSLRVSFDNQQDITHMLLDDNSQLEMRNGQPSSVETRSRDVAEIRGAIGRAIAGIAPERLDDIAAAMDANPHPLDAPEDTAPKKITAPKVDFKR